MKIMVRLLLFVTFLTLAFGACLKLEHWQNADDALKEGVGMLVLTLIIKVAGHIRQASHQHS